METLFVRYIENATTVEMIKLNAQGTVVESMSDISIPDLIKHLATAQSCICIAPGLSILSLEKNLPKLPTTKLLKAIPYALEEQLLDTVDQYHYVVTQPVEQGKTVILAVPKRLLSSWLQPWQHAKITCKAVYPDYLLIPYETNCWHVCVEKQALLRTGLYQGISCDIELLPTLLTASLQQCDQTQLPQRIVIQHYPLDIDTFSHPASRVIEEITQELAIPVDVVVMQEPLLLSMAKNYHDNLQPVNLLQHAFAQTHYDDKVKKLGKLALFIAGCAIAISILSTVADFIVLTYREHVLEKQIAVLYKEIYPQATNVVSPQLRMQRTLSELQANQVGGGYLGLLAMTAHVLHASPDIQITALRYQDNKLIIEIQTQHFSQLDQLMKQLNKEGLTAVQEQAAAGEANLVSARLTIERKHT